MNPSQPAVPSSLRRQALMEELRLLEQHQHHQQQASQQQQAIHALARDNLQLQMAGASSISDLMQAQTAHQGSGSMIRGRGGSIDLSTSGTSDTLLGMNELELSQLQAAMRLREQQQNVRNKEIKTHSKHIGCQRTPPQLHAQIVLPFPEACSVRASPISARRLL